MRVDAPHLRAIESAMAGDIDVIAGSILSGRRALVVKGFDLIRAGLIGADAESIVLQTAGSSLIHYNASESGSIFSVSDDRANETLSPTNSRVSGSFVPNTTNYVGVDLSRSVDDTTADTVQFIDTDSGSETPVQVALARTLDYRIVISTVEFSATPSVCPLFKVVTSTSNAVTSLEDARNLMFRLGSGGSSPQSISPYGWPSGRNEAGSVIGYLSGDRSIPDLKSWMDAAMTRIWEIGGGPYWYSQTADRNVRFCTSTVFSTGSAFEWNGTNLYWQGLSFVFDNCDASYNEILDQTTPLSGSTNIADGECIYVDVDRTQNRTGGDKLVAAKGALQTLGGGATPGSRFVLAWRRGAKIFIRDQHFALGSTFLLATTAVAGTVRTSLTPDGTYSITDPVCAGLDYSIFNSKTATCAGISHNTDGGDSILAAGNLTVGRGWAAGDNDVRIFTNLSSYETNIEGASRYSIAQKAALTVFQNSPAPGDKSDRIAQFRGYDGITTAMRAFFEAGGAMGLANVNAAPTTPAPTGGDPARVKIYMQTNGVASPNTRDLLLIKWFDGSTTTIAQSPTY